MTVAASLPKYTSVFELARSVPNSAAFNRLFELSIGHARCKASPQLHAKYGERLPACPVQSACCCVCAALKRGASSPLQPAPVLAMPHGPATPSLQAWPRRTARRCCGYPTASPWRSAGSMRTAPRSRRPLQRPRRMQRRRSTRWPPEAAVPATSATGSS